MHSLVRAVFSRLHSIDPETEEAKLVPDDEEAEIKMSVSSTQIPNEAGGDESQELVVDAPIEELEPKEAQTPSSAFVPRAQCKHHVSSHLHSRKLIIACS